MTSTAAQLATHRKRAAAKYASAQRRRVQEAARDVVRAARAHRRGTFGNVITGAELPVRHGVEFNKQMYDPRGLHQWFGHNPTVPHSRRPVTSAERKMVEHAARVANGHEGWMPAHEFFANNARGKLRDEAAALQVLKAIVRGDDKLGALAKKSGAKLQSVGWNAGDVFEWTRKVRTNDNRKVKLSLRISTNRPKAPYDPTASASVRGTGTKSYWRVYATSAGTKVKDEQSSREFRLAVGKDVLEKMIQFAREAHTILERRI